MCIRLCLLTVLLSIDHISGLYVEIIPQKPVVGGEVTLSVGGFEGGLHHSTWYLGLITDTPHEILSYHPGFDIPQTNGNSYFPRASAFPNGSLHIKNLSTEDRRTYTALVESATRLIETASVNLTLYFLLSVDYISGIYVDIIPQDPVVDSEVTFTISDVKGGIHHSTWYKGPVNDSNHEILTYHPGFNSPQTNGTLYFPRAYAFLNGSLHIDNLEVEDSGTYTVFVDTQTGSIELASAKLTVYDTSSLSQDSNGGVIAGIVCGALVGIALIISITFLLYKRYSTLHGREPPSNRQDPSTMNNHESPTIKDLESNEEPYYMDLQCESNEIYNDLKE